MSGENGSQPTVPDWEGREGGRIPGASWLGKLATLIRPGFVWETLALCVRSGRAIKNNSLTTLVLHIYVHMYTHAHGCTHMCAKVIHIHTCTTHTWRTEKEKTKTDYLEGNGGKVGGMGGRCLSCNQIIQTALFPYLSMPSAPGNKEISLKCTEIK